MRGQFKSNAVTILLTAVALAVSGYLAYVALAGHASGPGCGGGGCEHVLASHWSKVFNIPVALGAVGVYGLIWLMLVVPAPTVKLRWFTPRQGLLAILAAIAAAAAVWFTFLQFVVIGKVCPLCMTAHICGGGAAGAILIGLYRAHRARIIRHVAIGLATVALITTVQTLFPSRTAVVFRDGEQATVRHQDPTQYVIAIGDGRIQLNPTQLPVLGAADADPLLLLLYDYTCPHCRRLHQFLQAGQARYGKQLGVVLIPVPLNGDCNPDITETEPRHEHACEYAQLALAVWRHTPQAFDRYDRYLTQGELPPTPDEARAKAAELLGEDELTAALTNPWPNEQLERNVGLYRALTAAMGGGGGLPMLLSGGVFVAGRTHDAEELFTLLEAELGLTRVTDQHNPAIPGDTDSLE